MGLLIGSSRCFSWAWPAQVLCWSKDGLLVNTTRFLSDLFGEQLEKISLPLPLRQNECCATSREGLSHLKCRAILWWLCDLGDYRVTAHYDTCLLSNIAFIGGGNILVCFIVIQQLAAGCIWFLTSECLDAQKKYNQWGRDMFLEERSLQSSSRKTYWHETWEQFRPQQCLYNITWN